MHIEAGIIRTNFGSMEENLNYIGLKGTDTWEYATLLCLMIQMQL